MSNVAHLKEYDQPCNNIDFKCKANVNGKRVSGHPPACSLEGRVIWPLLSLLCTAHAQYNYHGLSKHPVFDMYRKCLNCTGNVEVK